MAEYEKDFVMRQAKDLAKGLSQFLEQDAIDQILHVDQESTQKRQVDKFIENELDRFKEEDLPDKSDEAD